MAFKVGSRKTHSINEMDTMVRLWLFEHSDLKLDGYTYGNYSDWTALPREYKKSAHAPTVKLHGLVSKPALNGKPVSELAYNKAKNKYEVSVGTGKKFIVKPEKLEYADNCAATVHDHTQSEPGGSGGGGAAAFGGSSN